MQQQYAPPLTLCLFLLFLSYALSVSLLLPLYPLDRWRTGLVVERQAELHAMIRECMAQCKRSRLTQVTPPLSTDVCWQQHDFLPRGNKPLVRVGVCREGARKLGS